jgi:hypothetical protein
VAGVTSTHAQPGAQGLPRRASPRRTEASICSNSANASWRTLTEVQETGAFPIRVWGARSRTTMQRCPEDIIGPSGPSGSKALRLAARSPKEIVKPARSAEPAQTRRSSADKFRPGFRLKPMRHRAAARCVGRPGDVRRGDAWLARAVSPALRLPRCGSLLARPGSGPSHSSWLRNCPAPIDLGPRSAPPVVPCCHHARLRSRAEHREGAPSHGRQSAGSTRSARPRADARRHPGGTTARSHRAAGSHPRRAAPRPDLHCDRRRASHGRPGSVVASRPVADDARARLDAVSASLYDRSAASGASVLHRANRRAQLPNASRSRGKTVAAASLTHPVRTRGRWGRRNDALTVTAIRRSRSTDRHRTRRRSTIGIPAPACPGLLGWHSGQDSPTSAGHRRSAPDQSYGPKGHDQPRVSASVRAGFPPRARRGHAIANSVREATTQSPIILDDPIDVKRRAGCR